MRRLENRHVLESEGTSDKKSAKCEQLRIEYSMNINELQRNLEHICNLADCLKKQKNELQITLEKHEIKNQDLLDSKKFLDEKLEQLENSLENHNEDLELSQYSTYMERSVSEIKIQKSPKKKVKKVPKKNSSVKSLQFIPAQIAQVKKIKEKLGAQISELKSAIDENELKIVDKKNLIALLEAYKISHFTKILAEELNHDKNTESDFFVQSINISLDEVQSTNPNTSKTRVKKQKTEKKQKNCFSHISLYTSILCIKIF